MHFAKTLATAAIAMLAASPVLARPANPAANLSLKGESNVPKSQAGKLSYLGGGGNLVLILAGIGAVVGVAVALGSHDSKPASN